MLLLRDTTFVSIVFLRDIWNLGCTSKDLKPPPGFMSRPCSSSQLAIKYLFRQIVFHPDKRNAANSKLSADGSLNCSNISCVAGTNLYLRHAEYNNGGIFPFFHILCFQDNHVLHSCSNKFKITSHMFFYITI